MTMFAFTTFGHVSLGAVCSLFALAVAWILGMRCRTWRLPAWFTTLTVVAHNAPDIDSVTFAFGLTHHDTLGHRGVGHSLIAGLAVAVILAWLAMGCERFEPPRLWHALFALWFFASFAMHIAADMLCDTDEAVLWGWPLVAERQLFDVRPVPYFSYNLSDGTVLSAFVVELQLIALWIVLPCCSLLGALAGTRRILRKRWIMTPAGSVREPASMF